MYIEINLALYNNRISKAHDIIKIKSYVQFTEFDEIRLRFNQHLPNSQNSLLFRRQTRKLSKITPTANGDRLFYTLLQYRGYKSSTTLTCSVWWNSEGYSDEALNFQSPELGMVSDIDWFLFDIYEMLILISKNGPLIF